MVSSESGKSSGTDDRLPFLDSRYRQIYTEVDCPQTGRIRLSECLECPKNHGRLLQFDLVECWHSQCESCGGFLQYEGEKYVCRDCRKEVV